jgi:hypothetical protein
MILYRKARLEVHFNGNDVELWWPDSLVKGITLHEHVALRASWKEGDVVTVSISNTRRTLEDKS